MNRNEAMFTLVGRLAGISDKDPDHDEKIERLIDLERKFSFSEMVPILVRTKLYQKFPVDDDLLARAAQLAAIKNLNAAGLSTMHTGDFSLMEIESAHRAWGQVRVYAPNCRESQVHFAKFLQTGSLADKKRVIVACRSNR